MRGTNNGTAQFYLTDYDLATPQIKINDSLFASQNYTTVDTEYRLTINIQNADEFKSLLNQNIGVRNNTSGVSLYVKEIRLMLFNVTFNGVTKGLNELVYFSNKYPGHLSNYGNFSTVNKQAFGFVEQNLTNVFATCTGMMFSRWIDNINGIERDNGLGEGAAIHNLPYMIESIIRDYILTERNLIATQATADNPVVKCDGLLSNQDGYYVNAIYINPYSDHKSYITAYNGATKEFTLNAADPDMVATEGGGSVNARFYLTNIKGNEKIDYQSFDAVGGPAGNRSAWLGRGFIDTQEKSEDILNKLLFESACILQRTDNKYKLVSLETTVDSVDTWIRPLYDRNRSEYIYSFDLTPIENVFSSFVLNYDYDAARRTYKKQIYVNANGYSEGSTIIGSSHSTKCRNAELNYLIKNKLYSYDAKFIYDHAVAERLLAYLVDCNTIQKPIITWGMDINHGIKYEIGDQVKLNNASLIPAALNNNTRFMISGKQVMMLAGASYIIYTLTLPRGL
jgi:hypothetical protein